MNNPLPRSISTEQMLRGRIERQAERIVELEVQVDRAGEFQNCLNCGVLQDHECGILNLYQEHTGNRDKTTFFCGLWRKET